MYIACKLESEMLSQYLSSLSKKFSRRKTKIRKSKQPPSQTSILLPRLPASQHANESMGCRNEEITAKKASQLYFSIILVK